MRLILGPDNRELPAADKLLERFLADPTETGNAYIEYVPRSSPDELLPEDLAVTLLVNSNASRGTFLSIWHHAPEINDLLAGLPGTALEESDRQLRSRVVQLIGAVGSWPGIKVSVATKLLHKKRPALVPVLDNQAIFGALLWPGWEPPGRVAKGDSIDGRNILAITAALEAVYRDLTRPENEGSWSGLSRIATDDFGKHPTRIELFDMIWWRYFRDRQPTRQVPSRKTL